MTVLNSTTVAAGTRTRVRTMDLLRVITFGCVVFVHTYGAMNPETEPSMGAVSLVMHFTRYAFVFITAFVLFYGYYHRHEKSTTFWRKRFGAVALPYVLWSLIYTAVTFLTEAPDNSSEVVVASVANLAMGTGWFHLYFLLVSMQFYLFFPVAKWLVRKTEGHHVALLAVATAVQVGIFWVFTYVPAPDNYLLEKIWFLRHTILPTYTIFWVLGALFAVHHERIRAFVLRRLPVFGLIFGGGLAVSLGAYFTRVHDGISPTAAGSPFNPDILPWIVGATLGLFALCTWWDARRRADSFLSKAVDKGAYRAFGVYATHPLMIHLQWIPWHEEFLAFFGGHRVVAGFAFFATTMVLTLLFVEFLLHTPVAKAFVGRARLR